MPRLASALLAVALAAGGGLQSEDNQPAQPFRIADNLYYVGARDIASYLITTKAGHILIDGGYVQTVPIIRANLVTLGFRVEDIKVLLTTQAHFDHVGGVAELKRLSGATLMVSDADAAIIEKGGRGDFYLGDKALFPAATVDRRVKDLDTVTLGEMVLTAHLTPGHTKGCTTWTFDVRDRGRTYHVVNLCGLSILDGTRVSGMPGYPNIARDYSHTYEVLKGLPCDIFIGAHASYYGGQAKAAALRAKPDGDNPFVDPEGYRTFIERAERKFLDQLTQERK
jgi:metallo-beta-lactamase class B